MVEVVDRAGWRQRSFAGLALLNAVLAAIMFSRVGNEFSPNGTAYMLAVITAVPVVIAARRAFEVACRFCAVFLMLVMVPLIFYGSLGFLPSAIFLFIAGFSGRRRSHSRTWATAIAILAVAVSAPWSIAIWPSLLGSPNAYVVHVGSRGPQPDSAIMNGDGSGIGYGADAVWLGPDVLYVWFRSDLSKADRLRLERHLRDLMPYATIERCHSRREC